MLIAVRRFVAYLLLAVIVMTAIMAVMLRLLTPMLSEYRADIEQWAGQLVQQPISIGTIEARMVGFSPQLNLVDVELLDLERKFPVARFGGLSIHFGILSSLMNGKITLDHIDLYGLDISLVRDMDGLISVSGLGGIKREDSESQSEQAGRKFGAWLLQQGKVSLHKSHIRWIDIGQQQSLDFPELSVTLINSGKHHAIYTLLELPEELGGVLEVDLKLTGDLFDNRSWSGEIYLRGEALNSRNLLKGAALKEWKLHQGFVDGEFWGEIDAGALTQVQGRFEARGVELEYKQKRLPLSRFDTQALLKRVDSGWQLQLSRLNFDGVLRGKMPRYLQLKQEDGGWRLNFDQINMAALQPVISVIKPDLFDKRSQFGGYLRTVDLYYGRGIESFRASVDQIEFAGINGLPAVSGLTGRVDLNDSVVSLALNSPNLGLEIPPLFEKKLPPFAVDGTLSASWDRERWQLWTHQLQLKNGDLRLKIATNLQSRINPSKQTPLIAMTGEIDVVALERLKHYIPDKILSEGISNWLKTAFYSGAVKGGKLLIYGRGREIFTPSKGGRMEIAISPKAVDLQFNKEWPRIEEIDADLRFSGRKMTLYSSKGRTLSSGTIDDLVVKIDNFKAAHLEVDGLARFNAMDGISYISISPLEKILGKVGEQVRAEGDLALKLHLGIPLGRKSREAGKKASVEGKLNFKKVVLDIGNRIKIDKVGGVLAFNQSGVKRSTVNARIFERPSKLLIYKRRKGDQDSTFITTRSRSNIEQVLAGIGMPRVKELSGEIGWKGVVEFNHTQKSAQLNIDSNLRGVESRLPHPVNKGAGQVLPFNLQYQFAGRGHNHQQIDMTLAKRVSAQLKFPMGGGELSKIHIHLGADRLKESKYAGLLFTGRLSRLDSGSWLKVIANNHSTQGAGRFDLPIRIDMQRLHILNKRTTNDKIEKKKTRLQQAGRATFLPSSLPPINVDINALKYGSLQLGGVVVGARSAKNGLTIKRLVIADGNHRLVANGMWSDDSGTHFKLKLTAKDTGKMLKTLRFDIPLKRGELSAEGTLRWSNSPFDFGLEKAKGSFKVKVNDGVIEGIGSDTGKLLGLLNVRKLLNRIFLDFSDLKEKSVSYRDMGGSFRISNGNLFTDDFHLRSLQADMKLTGRTGLVKRDYDHHLSIIPKIADAVPVAGTLLFGPQVAMALLTFRQIFGGAVDKASMQNYRITGSWDRPEIKKIGGKN